jgi:SAM-dependent methyltransferase
MTTSSSISSANPPPAAAGCARILVYVVAYHAEDHIVSVFERIPKELFEDERVHFLVIDDASEDAGPEVLARWLEERGVENATVLRNPVNQGYGGNQKLGYRYAIDAGFDLVILLHGDGQYAPELLPRFIEIWQETGADVILGSRMRSLSSARRGGMPLYKMVGNRILTRFQNALTGRELTEYHTGYRAYSTAFLRKVPFEIDTNDFHFDTEILLQAMHVGAELVEFDIPTHYGDEISRVNGLRYAWDVVTATIQYKLHQLGILCSLKLRDLQQALRDRANRAYSSETMALEILREQRPRRLLHIGCGPGFVARRCEELGIEVTGLGDSEPLPGSMTRHEQWKPGQPLPVDPFDYDAVLMLDVLERHEDAERFLLDMRNQSRQLPLDGRGPLVIVSAANVAFAAMRLNLLLGRFTYSERGILQVSHKRVFTRGSLLRTLRDCGYAVETVRPVPVPWEAVLEGRAGRWLGLLSAGLARLSGRLFAFQFQVTCRPLPGVRHVLAESRRHRFAGRE